MQDTQETPAVTPTQEYLKKCAEVAQESADYIKSAGKTFGYTTTNFNQEGIHLVTIQGDLVYCSTLLASLEIANKHFQTPQAPLLNRAGRRRAKLAG